VIRINQNSIAPDVKEKSKSWTLNTGVFQTRIEANQDLIVAGKVYEKITNEKSDKAVEGLDQIQINKGNVIIPNDLKDKETIDKAKIQHVKGVKKVQIIDKLKIKTE
jgi:exonuclease I